MQYVDDADDDVEDIPLRDLRDDGDEDGGAQRMQNMAFLTRTLSKYKRLKFGFKALLIGSCLLIVVIMVVTYRSGLLQQYPTELYNITETGTTPASFSPYTEVAQVVLADMDVRADPCEDFYQYACGGWLQRTQLAADEVRHSRSFSEVVEANAAQTLATMEAGWPYISTLYESCMDEAALSVRGSEPIEAHAEALGGATTLSELMTETALLRRAGLSLDVFFSAYVSIDDRNPTQYILQLYQAHPNLPEEAQEQGYIDWMGDMFAASPSGALNTLQLQDLLNFERSLVDIGRTPAENRDPVATYNLYSYSDALALLGELSSYLETLQLNVATVNVAQPEYFTALAGLLSGTSVGTLRNYALLALYSHSYAYLDAAHSEVAFAYRSLLYGIEEQPSRSEICVSVTKSVLGFLVAQYFVEYNFDAASKAAVEEMILGLESSYDSTMRSLAWMDSETRTQAVIKLGLIHNMVGYPEEDGWPDYDAYFDSFRLQEDLFFENVMGLSASHDRAALDALASPVDRTAWLMEPDMVNAYYEPLTNTIVFPAGIIQEPFFSFSYPTAMNYGALGSVVGHELGHAFDDSGSQYAGDGSLRDWWSASSREQFDEAAQCVADLYSTYEVQPGVYLDGELVLGESIADLGGLHQSYLTYRRWAEDNTAAAAQEEQWVQESFAMTGDQLFMTAFAQTWCNKATPEYETELAATNPHPVSRYRVQGSLSNSEAFASIFSCAANSTYNRIEKCVIW